MDVDGKTVDGDATDASGANVSVLGDSEVARGRGRSGRGSRWAARFCWLAVTPGTAWAVVRVGGLERGPLVQLVAFTPYAAGLALVPLALAVALRRWWASALAAAVAATLIGLVVPRAVPGGNPPATGPTLRVLTANLLAGSGDPATLVGLVRSSRADVLAVQEFTPAAAAGLDRLGLADLLPYRVLNAEDGTSGSGLYSRFPITEPGVRRNGGGFSQAYGTLSVPRAAPVHVESVHPVAPFPLRTMADWRRDLTAEPPATPGGPVRILAGDFNSTLDHAPLRALLATGYADAAERAGAGLVGTWGPYAGDLIPPVTIDHVLVDRRVAVRTVAVRPLPPSDHRTLFAELTLPAAGTN